MQLADRKGGSIRYRQAERDDLDALLQIEQQSFRSDLLSRRQLRYLLTRANAFTLLAASGSTVVGYCIYLTPALPRPARLYSLAVSPAFRGRGIASTLIKKVLDHSRRLGYAHCRLEVRKKDRKARRLYEGFGFVKLEELAQYYQDGADGIRMERRLSLKK